MHAGGTGTSINFLKMIKDEINKCQFRIDETEESKKQSEEQEKKLAKANGNIDILNATMLYTKNCRKKLVEYNAKKKERSLQSIYTGIYSARTIIPDTTQIRLSVTREEAALVNEMDDDVNLVEGSAFRATLSFFTKSVVLRNTQYMQMQLLDEPLTTLSPESSAALSAYLPILANECQIILIEQKAEVFTNIPRIVYHFTKSEGKTRVRRTVQ